MSSDHRFRPQRLNNGVVVQSGVDLKHRMSRTTVMDPTKRPFRAVVVNSRTIDDGENLRQVSVECDVILIRTQIGIRGVRVAQRQHGVNNLHDMWVPRPSTRNTEDPTDVVNVTRVMSNRGTFIAPATPLGLLDGDHVLVDFIEGNPDYPIITAALPHERTNRQLRSGAGWREGSVEERGSPKADEYYTHHYGCELRINEQGELLIDTNGAYTDPVTEDNSVATGDVRIRVKDSQRLTIAMGDDEDVLEVFKDGSQVRIDLGEAATDRLILGDAFKTYIDAELAKINTFWSALYNNHVHSGGTGMGGLTGPPGVTQSDTISTMPDSTLSDLASTKKS